MSVVDNSTIIGKVLEWGNQNQVLFASLTGGGILLFMCLCCLLGALVCRNTYRSSREYDRTSIDDM